MASILWIMYRYRSVCATGVVLALLCAGTLAPATAQTPAAGGDSVAAELSDRSVESLFVDFLHYANLGRFVAAESHAQALLAHPGLNPVELLEIADRHRKSMDTLQTIIAHSTIGDSASRVLEVIERGQYEKRKDPNRIARNIRSLNGHAQQWLVAVLHLIDSGEYAIPPLVQTLLDPAEQALWPRVIEALPRLGKSSVNPLVIALAVDDEDVRQNLVHALGEIGYAQAVPYLRRLIAAPNVARETKARAAVAIQRIETLAGREIAGAPEDLFFHLAEQYYDDGEVVRADPRLDEANIWYWDRDAGALSPVVVPRRIFGPVMAMRCCEEALLLKNDHAGAIALWLAANTRREARLGMDTESGDPNETGDVDPTRPDPFPRALYFTQAAGPRYAHLVLGRAVKEADSAVALGAIRALRITAGETSLIGNADSTQPLAQCLRFPDPVVRIRAAIALGAALPRSQFEDSQFVIPVLAGALTQTGREQVLVVDSDQNNVNRVVSALRDGDRDVIGETSFFKALERVRTEFQTLSGAFIGVGTGDSGAGQAIRGLRSEFLFAKTPVVLLSKEGSLAAEQLARGDTYVEVIDAGAGDTDLEEALERVRARTDQAPLDSDLALSLALETAETLRGIAVDGRTVYDVSAATPALIGALSSSDELLQTTAASVLALVPESTAQRAIAHVALDSNQPESLRIAAFGSLAESAKSNGGQLEDAQITALVRIARDDANLVIRTAASQALGAINLAGNKASDIIRSHYGG